MGGAAEDSGPAMEESPGSRSPSPPHSLATLLPVNLSLSTCQALVVVSALPPAAAAAATTSPLPIAPVLLTSEISQAVPPPPLHEEPREEGGSTAPSPEPVRTAAPLLRHSVAGHSRSRVFRRAAAAIVLHHTMHDSCCSCCRCCCYCCCISVLLVSSPSRTFYFLPSLSYFDVRA